MAKRFWRGKKRLAKKYMGNSTFNKLFKYGIPKVGDLTHDCDGFNHIISIVRCEYYQAETWGLTISRKLDQAWLKGDAEGIALVHRREKNSQRKLKYVWTPDVNCGWASTYLEAESGEYKPYHHSVCTCQGLGWQVPESRETIEFYYEGGWGSDWNNESAKEYSWYPQWAANCATIRAGGHIVDERGLLIPHEGNTE